MMKRVRVLLLLMLLAGLASGCGVKENTQSVNEQLISGSDKTSGDTEEAEVKPYCLRTAREFSEGRAWVNYKDDSDNSYLAVIDEEGTLVFQYNEADYDGVLYGTPYYDGASMLVLYKDAVGYAQALVDTSGQVLISYSDDGNDDYRFLGSYQGAYLIGKKESNDDGKWMYVYAVDKTGEAVTEKEHVAGTHEISTSDIDPDAILSIYSNNEEDSKVWDTAKLSDELYYMYYDYESGSRYQGYVFNLKTKEIIQINRSNSTKIFISDDGPEMILDGSRHAITLEDLENSTAYSAWGHAFSEKEIVPLWTQGDSIGYPLTVTHNIQYEYNETESRQLLPVAYDIKGEKLFDFPDLGDDVDWLNGYYVPKDGYMYMNCERKGILGGSSYFITVMDQEGNLLYDPVDIDYAFDWKNQNEGYMDHGYIYDEKNARIITPDGTSLSIKDDLSVFGNDSYFTMYSRKAIYEQYPLISSGYIILKDGGGYYYRSLDGSKEITEVHVQ